jgi:D-galactarolactone cycloisomerase
MKIQAIEAFPLRYEIPSGPYGSARGMHPFRSTCLVRVEADNGLVGVGESYGAPRVAAAIIQELAPIFLGQDPFDHEKHSATAINGRYHWGRHGLFTAALSGIEIACWDLMGQSVGLPVAKLLGGWNRDDVIAYASTGYHTEDFTRFEAMIEHAAAEGFRYMKIKCGDGIGVDLERVDTAYEIAGQDIGLMVDLNGNYTADLALQFALELQERGVVWLEEPLPPEDLTGYERLRDGSTLPIASGETDALRVGFRELITRRLVDFIQPDVTICGGFAEAKAIVRMAQAWNIRFAPHVWGGGVALAAALQLTAAIPAYPHVAREAAPILFEYDRGPNGLREELLTTPIEAKEGRVTIPTGPGLGVEVDWDAVERYRF